MSWTKFSSGATPADAAAVIRQSVALQRRTGIKNEYAIEATADLFCMTPRRIRQWCYEEIGINPSAHECTLIMRRWWAVRDIEVRRLRKLADELERGLDREREALQQPQLWGLDAQTDHGMDRGAAHALARRARQHLDKFDQAEAAYREARRGPLK